jgi:hypothetical protein
MYNVHGEIKNKNKIFAGEIEWKVHLERSRRRLNFNTQTGLTEIGCENGLY